MAGDRNRRSRPAPVTHHWSAQPRHHPRSGDTFTQGEDLKFTGIPELRTELFRSHPPRDPLKQKQLLKGLVQLSEEGAVQVFRPADQQRSDRQRGRCGCSSDVAVSRLLKSEYNVEGSGRGGQRLPPPAGWKGPTCQEVREFKRKNEVNLALDGGDNLSPHIAPTMVNLRLARSVTRTFSSARPASTDNRWFACWQ